MSRVGMATAVASLPVLDFGVAHTLNIQQNLSSTSLSSKWQSTINIEQLALDDDDDNHDKYQRQHRHHRADLKKSLHLTLPRHHGVTTKARHGSLPLPKSNKASSRTSSKSKLSSTPTTELLSAASALTPAIKVEQPYIKYLMPEPPCDSRTSSREFRMREVAQHTRCIFRGMTNRDWRAIPCVEDSDQTLSEMRWARYDAQREGEDESEIEDMIG